MTKYREIIRLTGLGFSQRNIMASCGVAQKTVVKVQKRARELNLSWPLDESMTDTELQRLMFAKESLASKNKRMPDYDYIHKELLRNGVSKKLLWTEYMEDCRANGDEPLMYSQFCYHIQQDEQKRRATMHINRKPGEQVEVDWAGDPATIIDPDTGEILKAYIFVGVMTYSQYAYVEAFLDMKQKSWITAHVHMYEFLAVLPEYLYRITARLQLSIMVDGKTSRSMKLIRKWLSTMVQLSSLLVSEHQRISRMLKER